jgi:hypothetical protein
MVESWIVCCMDLLFLFGNLRMQEFFEFVLSSARRRIVLKDSEEKPETFKAERHIEVQKEFF